MSAPRHRLEPADNRQPVNYTPNVQLRSIDFDAVAPMRRTPAREPEQSSIDTSEALYLAHS